MMEAFGWVEACPRVAAATEFCCNAADQSITDCLFHVERDRTVVEGSGLNA